jgi:cytochrome c biogenesis protein
VSLVSYAGDLGMNSGVSQSVYQLDTGHMHRLAVAPRPLAPGQSMKLPNGMGTLTFTGYRQWISLAITYDPGQLPALFAAIAALAGLLVSFLVRRRRVFVRAAPGAGGGATVEFGGLARTESSETLGAEFTGLSAELSAALAATGERDPHGNVPPDTTPAGTSPTAHAAPVPSADLPASSDLPSSSDERE